MIHMFVYIYAQMNSASRLMGDLHASGTAQVSASEHNALRLRVLFEQRNTGDTCMYTNININISMSICMYIYICMYVHAYSTFSLVAHPKTHPFSADNACCARLPTVCCVTQQTCLRLHTADMSAVSHNGHVCCVTRDTADMLTV